MAHARYCSHCGQALAPSKTVTALEDRLARVEAQLRVIDLHDPRIGAEGWPDTIRRIVRDVLRQEGR